MVKLRNKWIKRVHFEVAGTTYELKINKFIYIGKLKVANKI